MTKLFGALTSGPQFQIHAVAEGGVQPTPRSASTDFGAELQFMDEPKPTTNHVPWLWWKTISDGPALLESSLADAYRPSRLETPIDTILLSFAAGDPGIATYPAKLEWIALRSPAVGARFAAADGAPTTAASTTRVTRARPTSPH